MWVILKKLPKTIDACNSWQNNENPRRTDDLATVPATKLDRTRSTTEEEQQEDKFRAIVEGAPDPIFIQTNNVFSYLNPAACVFFGIDKPEELLGISIMECIHPDNRVSVAERIKTLNIGRRPVTELFEQKFLQKDGSWVWGETKGEPIIYNGEKGALVFVRDMSKRRAAERYQKSFEDAAIGMCMTGMDGRLMSVNKVMCEIFGYTKEKLEGTHFEDITYREDIHLSNDAVHLLITGERKSATFEKRYIKKDGEIFWANTTATVLRDPDGLPVYFLSQIQDITEQKQMIEELRAREQFNRTVMDNLPIGISVNTVAPPLKFSYMNDKFPFFYRTTREAIKDPDTFFDVVYEDPEFRTYIREKVLGDMASGDPKRMRWDNVPLSRKGAETRYISAYNLMVPDKDIQISIVTDETERLQTTALLEKNAAHLQVQHEFDLAIIKGFESFKKIGETALGFIFALIKPERAGVGICNPVDNVLSILTADKNRAGYHIIEQRLTEAEKDALAILQRGTLYSFTEIPDRQLIPFLNRIFQLEGKTCGQFRPLYSSDNISGIIHIDRGETGSFSPSELETLQVIGTQIALAIEHKRLNCLNESYATGLEQMIQDRTLQLEAAVKELEAFSYSVSHDLRAPLRSIGGFVRILLEDYGSVLDDEGKRVCGVISSSVQQMGKLIDDLLSLSRIGRSSIVLMPVNMQAMAHMLYEELTTEDQRKQIEFSVGNLPEPYADPTLMRQVWMNLLDNAVKFSSKKPHPRITVTGEDAGKEIVYAVSDNGAGFDMKYQDKLFGVFQRLHSVHEFDGTGVGLAIVQRIMNRHGGKVWASGEENNGATFYFSIKKEMDTDVTGSN